MIYKLQYDRFRVLNKVHPKNYTHGLRIVAFIVVRYQSYLVNSLVFACSSTIKATLKNISFIIRIHVSWIFKPELWLAGSTAGSQTETRSGNLCLITFILTRKFLINPCHRLRPCSGLIHLSQAQYNWTHWPCWRRAEWAIKCNVATFINISSCVPVSYDTQNITVV